MFMQLPHHALSAARQPLSQMGLILIDCRPNSARAGRMIRCKICRTAASGMASAAHLTEIIPCGTGTCTAAVLVPHILSTVCVCQRLAKAAVSCLAQRDTAA
jgi:hypothetical protein